MGYQSKYKGKEVENILDNALLKKLQTLTDLEKKLVRENLGIKDQDLEEYATKKEVEDAISKIPIPDINEQISTHNEDASAHLNIQTELGKVKDSIPTNTSELTNDSGFLTEHQSLAHLATKDELKSKQDVISDLASIREGATKGATALQSIPDEYVTTSELDDKLESIKDDLLALEISEVGEVLVTYGEKSDFVGGQIRETGELVLEFNIE